MFYKSQRLLSYIAASAIVLLSPTTTSETLSTHHGPQYDPEFWNQPEFRKANCLAYALEQPTPARPKLRDVDLDYSASATALSLIVNGAIPLVLTQQLADELPSYNGVKTELDFPAAFDFLEDIQPNNGGTIVGLYWSSYSDYLFVRKDSNGKLSFKLSNADVSQQHDSIDTLLDEFHSIIMGPHYAEMVKRPDLMEGFLLYFAGIFEFPPDMEIQ
tara:strand:+ start:707 stop:1354 length:648 start_codon:yes stop_codon:yes gene_type:complete